MRPTPPLAAAALLALAACTDPTAGLALGADGCDMGDGALDTAAFVIATAPAAGARVSPGFAVTGCSRTFESTVNWELRARDGSVIAEGFTSGGGVDGPGPFSFSVDYAVAERQIGTLEVFEVDASDGEGFPPGRTVLPLVLQP